MFCNVLKVQQHGTNTMFPKNGKLPLEFHNDYDLRMTHDESLQDVISWDREATAVSEFHGHLPIGF